MFDVKVNSILSGKLYSSVFLNTVSVNPMPQGLYFLQHRGKGGGGDPLRSVVANFFYTGLLRYMDSSDPQFQVPSCNS